MVLHSEKNAKHDIVYLYLQYWVLHGRTWLYSMQDMVYLYQNILNGSATPARNKAINILVKHILTRYLMAQYMLF